MLLRPACSTIEKYFCIVELCRIKTKQRNETNETNERKKSRRARINLQASSANIIRCTQWAMGAIR